jgi:hypothetical protein
MPRYFTVTEAEGVLPEVERALRDALFHKAEAVEAQREMEESSERIRTLGGVRVNPAELMTVRARFHKSVAALKEALDEVEQLGAQIKDLDIGLIDFLARFRDRDVWLCWKLGEERISFWHGLEEGFRGRKPIDEDFIEGHGRRDGRPGPESSRLN